MQGSARPWMRWGAAVALLGATAAIYGGLVRADPLLARDDRRLVGSLSGVSSPAQYAAAVREGRILDVQPIRDLSLELDLALGGHTFHLTNALLWLAIVFGFFMLSRALTQSEPVALAFALLFALHPVFVGSVAWVSARKHLLSCAFILAATLWLIRASRRGLGWRDYLGVAALYAASLLSQPITLLWPLWAAAHRAWVDRRPKEGARLLGSCLPLACAAGAVNLWYYTGPFAAQSATGKFVGSGRDVGVALLAWGRSFANLAFPLRFSTSYDPGSALNLVGLCALPCFAYAALKLARRELAASWLVYFALPLAIVATRMTNIFVSDTYLLTPAIGFFCTLESLVMAMSPKASRVVAIAAVGLAAVFGAASWRLARTWQSDAALWAHAYETERTPNAMAKQSFFLIEAGRPDEALDVALALEAEAPEHPEASYVLSRAVYAARAPTPQEKLRLLEAHPSGDPWYSYYLGWLLAATGDAAGGEAHLRRALEHPEAFRGELAAVAAEAEALCGAAGRSSCAADTQRLRAVPGWDEPLYQRRATELRRAPGPL